MQPAHTGRVCWLHHDKQSTVPLKAKAWIPLSQKQLLIMWSLLGRKPECCLGCGWAVSRLQLWSSLQCKSSDQNGSKTCFILTLGPDTDILMLGKSKCCAVCTIPDTQTDECLLNQSLFIVLTSFFFPFTKGQPLSLKNDAYTPVPKHKLQFSRRLKNKSSPTDSSIAQRCLRNKHVYSLFGQLPFNDNCSRGAFLHTSFIYIVLKPKYMRHQPQRQQLSSKLHRS